MFSSDGTSISASAASHCGAHLRENHELYMDIIRVPEHAGVTGNSMTELAAKGDLLAIFQMNLFLSLI